MRHHRLLVVLLAAVAGSACGSDVSTTPTPVALAGTWTLTQVNGAPLPFVRQPANPKIELTAERIVVDAAATFTQTATLLVTPTGGTAATQAAVDSGTWTLSGTTATFRFASDNSVGVGTVSGTQFTVLNGGNTFVFTRQ